VRRRRSAVERTIGDARRITWRASSILGDVEAVASGSPARVGRRMVRKAVWRAIGKAMRGVLTGR
jgi:hypothetical protein